MRQLGTYRPVSLNPGTRTVPQGTPPWRHTPNCTAGWGGSCLPTLRPVARLRR